MKKIFKSMAILAATAAVGAGVGVAAGCDAGTNGTYTGSYSYTNQYGATYGMMVEVTVENNIITNVKDITNSDLTKQGGYVSPAWGQPYAYQESGVEWHAVSDGWSKYFMSYGTAGRLLYSAEEAGVTDAAEGDLFYKVTTKGEPDKYVKWNGQDVVPIENTKGGYGWSDDNEKTWTNHISWLLQKYVGWSVADVLDITVYTDYGYAPNASGSLVPTNTISGEPYEVKYNEELSSSGLLISGSTQGSGRLILAIQDALSK